MEHSLIATGIGGQGIQLSAQVLARALIHTGRKVMMFGSYGGMMRGGNTEATLVFADQAIDSPPVLSHTWIGVVMHHDYSEGVLDKVDERSLLFVNSSVVEDLPATAALRVEIPATDIAVDAATSVCATMVMVAAVAAATGITTESALASGLAEALPPYRKDQLSVNEAALRAGFERGSTAASTHTIAQAWAQ